jgi:hypothetical protein
MLFPAWRLPEQADAGMNARAGGLLREARDDYARAIDATEAALQVIEQA